MNSKSAKFKQENEFFINSKTNKLQYNKKCQNCVCDCKQSYKVAVIKCQNYKGL